MSSWVTPGGNPSTSADGWVLPAAVGAGWALPQAARNSPAARTNTCTLGNGRRQGVTASSALGKSKRGPQPQVHRQASESPWAKLRLAAFL